MNSYYGVKDQEYNSSFIEAKWLTPYEVLNKLQIKPNTNLPAYLSSANTNNQHINLIYPNELIYSFTDEFSPRQQLIDAILIAKYSTPTSNFRLKSVLLSQLIALPSQPMLVLSLPRDTYHWSKVSNVNLISSNALRVGFDTLVKQFTYIGRLKFDHLLLTSNGAPSSNNLVFRNNNNLFGSLINVYEYIPAILMQLNDISSLNYEPTSLWSRLRQSASNRLPFGTRGTTTQQTQQQAQQSIDFNLTTTNYEVLCLRKQPARLKQLCALKLNKHLEEDDPRLTYTIRALPYSIRSLICPHYLVPGQCLIKHGKMRSLNHLYEVSLSKYGVLRFVKLDDDEKQVATIEKNIESLLVLKSGIYLIYDSNQATRRPIILYSQQQNSSMLSSFYLEVTNDGYLRVYIRHDSNRTDSLDLFNLNEYFRPPILAPKGEMMMSGAEVEKLNLLNQKMIVKRDSLININLRVFVDELKAIPVKLINIVLTVLKTFVETILYGGRRVRRAMH